MRPVALLALTVALGGCIPPAKSDGPESGLVIRQIEISLEASRTNGLSVLSAYELIADPAGFGGFSGLLIDGNRLVAVSDQGRWLDAYIKATPSGLSLIKAKLTQMRDGAGDPVEKQGGDAEGLTRQGSATLVSFERDHRIMTRQGEANLTDVRQHRAFEAFATNQGLESLATLPDGRLLTIGEEQQDEGYVVYILSKNGITERGWLPDVTRHAPTGADLGPDGKLYVVFRHYSPLFGVSAIVRRYHLNDVGLPNPATQEDLATFESQSGIDNMEGISLWQGPDGRTRLTLISDDNFSRLQRTLLVDMVLD